MMKFGFYVNDIDKYLEFHSSDYMCRCFSAHIFNLFLHMLSEDGLAQLVDKVRDAQDGSADHTEELALHPWVDKLIKSDPERRQRTIDAISRQLSPKRCCYSRGDFCAFCDLKDSEMSYQCQLGEGLKICAGTEVVRIELMFHHWEKPGICRILKPDFCEVVTQYLQKMEELRQMRRKPRTWK